MENNTGYIYKITSPSGKIYIGSSSNFVKRVSYYKNLCCKGQNKLYNSLKKYGYDNHIVEIIEEPTLDTMLQREAYWGEYYDVLSSKGLNCNLPKYGDTYKSVSEETVLKISKAQKGRKLSEEHIKKLKEAHINRLPPSKESREKTRESLIGKNSRLVFDTINGIFYQSCREASEAIGCSTSYLSRMLTGLKINKTNLIYV